MSSPTITFRLPYSGGAISSGQYGPKAKMAVQSHLNGGDVHHDASVEKRPKLAAAKIQSYFKSQ